MSRSDEGYLDKPRTQTGPEASQALEVEGRTFSVAAVVRATGLSEHTLRAWERRHEAVVPLRSAAGTRRYRSEDVERLRRLRRVVDAGHRIGSVAKLSIAELDALLNQGDDLPEAAVPLAPLVAAIVALDADDLDRRLGQAFAALGARTFSLEVALPLLRHVGERWEAGELSIAAEHLASASLRNFLGVAMRSSPSAETRPVCLFATPSGETHELGTLAAAVVAADLGARVVFLGANLPVEEIAEAARERRAAVVVLGASCFETGAFEEFGARLRTALPKSTELWVGGPPAAACVAADRVVERIEDLEELLLLVA